MKAACAAQPESYSLRDFYLEAGLPRPDKMYDDIPVVLPDGEQPSPFQIENLNRILTNSYWGFLDEPGCVSGDTEFLTRTGWKRIDKYQKGDEVAQFDTVTENMSWCHPTDYIEKLAPYMVSIKGARGTDQLLSPDHDVLLRTGFSNLPRDGDKALGWKKLSAQEVLENPPNRNNNAVPLAFNYVSDTVCTLSDAELRVMVAVIADGTFPNKGSTSVIRLKKQRKIKRLQSLLQAAEIEYTVRPASPDGFVRISFTAPRRDKEFTAEYWGMPSYQLRLVVDEVHRWDGSVLAGNRGKGFYSTSKASADFVQFAYSACGIAASLRPDVRPGRPTCYAVITRGKARPYTFPRKEGVTRVPEPQKVYCFTVPYGNLVLRRNGYIFVTGNCGKTLPAQAYSIYMAMNGYRSLLVMPPVLRKQYVASLCHTFEGIEKHLTWHIFDQDPYPVRVNKKRVQEIKLAQFRGDPLPPDTPIDVAQLADRMKKAVPIKFKQREINQIRAIDDMKISDIAAKFGCSAGAVSQLRNKVFREDLVAKWDAEDSWPDLMLMSYAMFVKEMRNVEHKYPCLMADEAHALCHPSSTVHKKTRWFLENDDRTFLPMTGTPAPNVPTDTYGIIKLLNPEAYSNFNAFKRLHVDSYTVTDADDRKFTVINGYFNLDTMSRALYAKASRVTKDEVLKLDKPNIIEEEVALPEDHLQLYRDLVRKRVLEVDGLTISASDAQSLRQKVLQIVVNPEKFSDKPPKENIVKEWLTEKLDSLGCEHLEKVVVFAHFNASVERMAQWFEHLNPALLYGKSDTQKNLKKFLTDDTCRLMIAHPKSGGVGVDKLQTLCRYVIFVEPTSVPGDFTQALDRLVRRGQKHAVVCYILKVMKTAWPARVGEMRKKMKLISDVTLDKTALLDELLGDTY